jgi:hypothetical protein
MRMKFEIGGTEAKRAHLCEEPWDTARQRDILIGQSESRGVADAELRAQLLTIGLRDDEGQRLHHPSDRLQQRVVSRRRHSLGIRTTQLPV